MTKNLFQNVSLFCNKVHLYVFYFIIWFYLDAANVSTSKDLSEPKEDDADRDHSPARSLHESVLSLSLSNPNLDLISNKPARSITIKSRSDLSDSSSTKTAGSNRESLESPLVSHADVFPAKLVSPNETVVTPKIMLRKQKTFAGLSYSDIQRAQASDNQENVGLHRNATFSGLPSAVPNKTSAEIAASHSLDFSLAKPDLAHGTNQNEAPSPNPVVFNQPEPLQRPAPVVQPEIPVSLPDSKTEANAKNIHHLHRQATFGGRSVNDEMLPDNTDKTQLTRAERRELLRRATYAGLHAKDRAEQKNSEKISLQKLQESPEEGRRQRRVRQPSTYDNLPSSEESKSNTNQLKTKHPEVRHDETEKINVDHSPVEKPVDQPDAEQITVKQTDIQQPKIRHPEVQQQKVKQPQVKKTKVKHPEYEEPKLQQTNVVSADGSTGAVIDASNVKSPVNSPHTSPKTTAEDTEAIKQRCVPKWDYDTGKYLLICLGK